MTRMQPPNRPLGTKPLPGDYIPPLSKRRTRTENAWVWIRAPFLFLGIAAGMCVPALVVGGAAWVLAAPFTWALSSIGMSTTTFLIIISTVLATGCAIGLLEQHRR